MGQQTVIQDSLWCPCGALEVNRRGLCRRCDRLRRLSREHFGGLRERVLLRDEARCRCCGEFEIQRLVVHHRRPGANSIRLLLTLCRACHVRIHRTWRPRFGFSGELRLLWREQYPDLAEQRELPLYGPAPLLAVSFFQSDLFSLAA